MDPHPDPKIAIRPRNADWIDHAVTSADGTLVELEDAVAMVWTTHSEPAALAEAIADAPNLEWVQLPWAGVDPYLEVIRRHSNLRWTCAKGAYSEPVAEHALALLLAGFRNLVGYARADTWGRGVGRNLYGAHVTILGGGGIAQELVALLRPFRCEVTVVRNTTEPMDGVVSVLGPTRLNQAIQGAEALVIALPMIESTRGMVGREQLELLAPGAWVINIARGAHLDTAAVIDALDGGHLGGVGLDVTDPEPLPDGHPLWGRDNVIITPHTANTREMARPLLARRIRENIRDFAAGEPLAGQVDPILGY